MLDDSGSANRQINFIYLANERMKRGLLLLDNGKRKKDPEQTERTITQAYRLGLPIEITVSGHKTGQTIILKGRISHIDRRNKMILLINGVKGHTKLCTPISFARIISAKIIDTKLQ
ncbi:MAG TPA: YolD-like family protein [Bacillales bacterium]|nr:YolD-like family protein [Bacillales bacterium]